LVNWKADHSDWSMEKLSDHFDWPEQAFLLNALSEGIDTP
jgi:hypothetical protein